LSEDWRAQYDDLLRRARRLRHGKSQVDLLEEAVRLADLHHDDDRGFSARIELTSDATFSGFPEKALVAFGWCRAKCEKDPERFAERRLAWNNKLILHNLMTFPQITRAQIDDALADMEKRWQRCGLSMRPYHMFRAIYALELGRPDLHEHYAKWWKAKRDSMADCQACELDSRIMFLVEWRDYEEAIREAAPIVNGRMSCAEVPHRTLARLLLPALRLGMHDEAAEFQRRGERLIEANLQLLQHAGSHVTYLVLTKNPTHALEMFERHVPNALESFDKQQRFRFHLGARVLFRSLLRAKVEHVKLRVPEAFPIEPETRESDSFSVARVSEWIDGQCLDLATRFDRRNGTDACTREIAAHDGYVDELG